MADATHSAKELRKREKRLEGRIDEVLSAPARNGLPSAAGGVEI
jgi:hypothetical protein